MVKLLLLFGLFLLSPLLSASAPTLVRTCVMDSRLFPLWRAPGHEEWENPGLNLELYNIIANKLELQTDWLRAPFQRCLLLLQQGEVDLLNAASYQSSRDVYGRYPVLNGQIDPSKRLKYDTYHGFTLVSSKLDWDGNRFINNAGELPIAVEIGASIGALLSKLNISLIELSTAEQGFLMLKKHRVAAVVSNQNNGNKYADIQIRQLPIPIQTKAYYIMISHQFYAKYPELSEQIWSTSQLMQTIEFPQIQQKYDVLPPWEN